METLLNIVSAASFIGMMIFGAMLDSADFMTPIIGVTICGVVFFLSAILSGHVGDFEE